ncbi:MAG TPA: glycosyltransferase [Candidatus Brocadiia bacterium]|nr:glycosyltransferase [Candidatus Brocadiia bacterium]
MKILHVIPGIGTISGGPPLVCQALAKGQIERGHDARILSTLHGLIPEEERQLRERWGERLTLLPFFYMAGYLRPKGLNAAMRNLLPADIVHIHGIWSGLNTAVARRCRRLGVPYIIRTLGTLGPWALQNSGWKKKIYLRLYERENLDRAAAVHSLNKEEAEDTKRLGVRSDIVIITNGIESSFFDTLPPKGEFRAKHPETAGRFLILFLSRIHKKKGLEYLAEAFCLLRKRRPEAFLAVAGPEQDDSAEKAREILRRNGMMEHALFTGTVRGVEKDRLYVDSDIFVLPSFDEGHSMAITEAMAVGLPVIITPGCHFPEVGENGAGIIGSQSPEEIADSMQGLMDDAGQRRAMGEAGARLVRERYTWDSVVERALKVYGEIVEKGRTSEAIPRDGKPNR